MELLILLYKIVGEGTKQLADRKIGDVLSVIGPIGNGFEADRSKIPLLIGGGVGMPPMIAMAQEIKDNAYYNPYVILGSEVPFPFEASQSSLNGFNSSKFYTMPLVGGVAGYLVVWQVFKIMREFIRVMSLILLESIWIAFLR